VGQPPVSVNSAGLWRPCVFGLNDVPM
jgi:hypothetical protein